MSESLTILAERVHDVIVVGAGNAALTAALAAKEAGAAVLVLEKAPEAERGGNSRFSGAGFRFPYTSIDDVQALIPDSDLSKVLVDPYPADAYLDDIMKLTEGHADEELSRIVVGRAADTMRWMATLGMGWELTEFYGVPSGDMIRYPPGFIVQGRGHGVGLVQTLFDACAARGVPVAYEAAVVGFIPEGDGVGGVVVQSGEREYRLRAKTVIAAAGSFEANADMRAKYMGEQWRGVRVRGSKHDTGEVLASVVDLGAAKAGDWGGCHATPVDLNAPAHGDLSILDNTNRLGFPFGIMINADGRRFIDEGETYAVFTYAKMGAAILDQPQELAYQVFDQRSIPFLEGRYATTDAVVGATVEELADKISAPREALAKTFADFNAAAAGNQFTPGVLDGMSATGIVPPKSNWAQPLLDGPYAAYPVTCGITFAYGGVKFDADARVINESGRPIPGLYTCGEMAGFFHKNYPGGSGLARGAVFGRIAGTNAAKLAAS